MPKNIRLQEQCAVGQCRVQSISLLSERGGMLQADVWQGICARLIVWLVCLYHLEIYK
jgi:hypothetical protein